MGPVGRGGGCVGGARGLGVLGFRTWLATVAWEGAVSEVLWLRDVSKGVTLGPGVGGVGVDVDAAVSMCCCDELIHRKRMGNRKVGGSRDTGCRSSRAMRNIDLLIVTAGWRRSDRG
jgi:hypothetical protein